MTPIFYGKSDSAALADWVSRHLPGCERGWDRCVGMAVMSGRFIAAGVVYHDWNPENGTICMSAYAASPRWLTRRVLWHLFEYPFDQVGCQMVILQVSERNKRMLSILERFGFSMTRIPRGRGRDEDEIICTLTDDAWRQSKLHRCPDGKTQSANAA